MIGTEFVFRLSRFGTMLAAVFLFNSRVDFAMAQSDSVTKKDFYIPASPTDAPDPFYCSVRHTGRCILSPAGAA